MLSNAAFDQNTMNPFSSSRFSFIAEFARDLNFYNHTSLYVTMHQVTTHDDKFNSGRRKVPCVIEAYTRLANAIPYSLK